MILKDGSEVDDPRLDRLYQEDWNSLNYPVTMKLEQLRPYEEYDPQHMYWPVQEKLDQGQEGACVGFGYCHDALAMPHVIRAHNGEPVDAKFAREKVYWEAQKIDEWPGGSYPGAEGGTYEGTSVLAGAKIMQSLGLYSAYYWALDLKQLALAVSYIGPAVMGLPWYEGMGTPNPDGYVVPTGKVVGGHCILCVGVQFLWLTPDGSMKWENVDKELSYFLLHNSWGAGWGMAGQCRISLNDMEMLLNQNGDACIPERV